MPTPMDVDMDDYTITQMAEQLGQTEALEPVITPEEARILLEQEFQRILTEAFRADQFPEETGADYEPDINTGIDEEEVCFDMNSLENSEYYPYPNKTTMLFDVLDNLPRCCFTGAQSSLVIHFAKSLGAPNVPSLKGLRQIQKDLNRKCGKEPVKVNFVMGNILFMNDLHESIANDFANPLVAPHLQLYPEEVKSDISESWQSERWREYSPEQLTPMFAKGYKRFWIEEVAQTREGKFVIPHTWIKRRGVLTTDAQIVTRTEDGQWNLTAEELTIDADTLEFDFKDITAQFGKQLIWMEGSDAPVMPNKMRDLVEDDEDLFAVMVSPWADDVSGNKSKQYNKHMNVYTWNGCLPGRLLQQEFHMHYVSTSPTCVTDSGTKDKVTQYWIGKLLERYDVQRTANPRQNVANISQELQSWLNEQPGDKMNPLLNLTGLDPSQDTPVELLHPVLLGVIKYIWHFMNTARWKDEDRHLLAIRLQYTDLSGLTVPPYSRILHDPILAFHVDGIVNPEQLDLIVAAGNLGARLWVPVINDMESYLEDLNIAVTNLLDTFDAVDPLRIIIKIKLHLLTHIGVDIRRFGPAIHFSTEIFEAFNSVFRMCSVNSNHIAPSRDILVE
ncbi:hypothetical protein MSAN_01742800 [Mycena sanguinolenta]|uniref:Uncharacterized protein n=1 Tax=Mycena sanguinolenta TaxID=230812 RepID=A0A8H7CT89_9AGAR|nr:hypothetical protein MSAN_01742800 [Mycena sanguinolenta]